MEVGQLSRSKKKILIIGLGKLGQRHFEGSLEISIPLDIHLIDTNPLALGKALDIFDQHQNKNIHNLQTSELIPKGKNFDIALISTNSDVRKEVVVSLLGGSNCKYLILEKVAFQNMLHI